MANILPKERQIAVLHHLVEGNTLRSTARLCRVHRTTIMNLMVRFGHGCQKLMDRELRNLRLEHVEADEVWAYVFKKQGRLTTEEKAERADIGDVYLWTCIDEKTKLIAAHVVGKRSADNARRLMRQLAGRLVFPSPHESDNHAFVIRRIDPIVQISTDGFAGYREAIDQFFGPYASHGILIKDFRNRQLPGNYAPAEMVGSQRKVIRGDIGPFDIHTSHIERHNATVRTLMKRFTRLGLGFSKKLENHEAAIAGFLGFYNWCWRTRYPDDSGQAGRLRPTAAMMAGVTDRLWTFGDLFDAAMAA